MMKERNLNDICWDIGIVIVSVAVLIFQYQLYAQEAIKEGLTIFASLAILVSGMDLLRCMKKGHTKEKKIQRIGEIRRLLLLDEEERPIKTWEMAGKVALVIGKRNQQEPVDVDLSDCAYSDLIEEQHAVLNYCKGDWFVEDLSLQNGIRVKKVEDGQCYQVMKRPCKVCAGDIIYIANTKLLLS